MMRPLLILLFYILPAMSFGQAESNRIRFMFWNVENVFDTEDDTLTEDDDFLPYGIRRWNKKRYYKKITDISKTIIAAGEWETPAIIGLCEVENRKVIEDLIYKTPLQRYQLGIIHEDSPDERGIDVCIVYRKDIVQPITYNYILPAGLTASDYSTRTVLHSIFRTPSDTIHIFMNHWPSRVGGVLAGEDMRLRIASMIRANADSLQAITSCKSNIIIAGDFNCTPGDNEIKTISGTNITSGYVNLTAFNSPNGGTYRYHGVWEMIDQVIVSKHMLTSITGLYTDQRSFNIYRPGFLLIEDPSFPGKMPFSTYRGMRYQGGISDHLPVTLDCYLRGKQE